VFNIFSHAMKGGPFNILLKIVLFFLFLNLIYSWLFQSMPNIKPHLDAFLISCVRFLKLRFHSRILTNVRVLIPYIDPKCLWHSVCKIGTLQLILQLFQQLRYIFLYRLAINIFWSIRFLAWGLDCFLWTYIWYPVVNVTDSVIWFFM
jgi:hypothetical protein